MVRMKKELAGADGSGVFETVSGLGRGPEDE